MSDTDSDFETGATGRKLAECQRQLAEARAALRDAEWWLVCDLSPYRWMLLHAAALKAAREQS